MAKQNETLFEESSQGAVSAVTVFTFIVSLVLFFGGLALMGYSFEPNSPNMLIFILGLATTTIGAMIPFTVLPALGK